MINPFNMKMDAAMKIDLARIRRILIIQIRPFGDVLLNTGYLPFLRKRFPDAKIHLLVRHPYQHILDGNPYIDDCVVFGNKKNLPTWLEKLRLFARVRKYGYDLVIDQIQGSTSAQIVLFSSAPYRIASTKARWRFLYNIRVPYRGKRYSASMKFDLLQPLGVEESAYGLDYTIQPSSMTYIQTWLKDQSLDNQPFVCISPGSPREKKKWDPVSYARLADMIHEKLNRQVVLLWGPGEKKDAERVVSNMKVGPLLAPPTDFNQAAALLKTCELLVCNDGGLNHLSVATQTPSLAIFGNTNPVTWSPGSVFPQHHHLYNPDWPKMSNNLFGVTPAEAFEKVQSIIRQIHP